jgi:hypothetical protein
VRVAHVTSIGRASQTRQVWQWHFPYKVREALVIAWRRNFKASPEAVNGQLPSGKVPPTGTNPEFWQF